MRPRSTHHRLALWVAAVYVAALALVVFWPTPVDRGIDPALIRMLTRLHEHGWPNWIDYDFVQNLANVLMFVPFGFLVVLLVGRRRWWLGIVLGFIGSCAIELAQHFFLPARFATIADVVANTAGAAIGALLGVVIIVSRPRSRTTAE